VCRFAWSRGETSNASSRQEAWKGVLDGMGEIGADSGAGGSAVGNGLQGAAQIILTNFHEVSS